jgi:hypothetical protein
MIGNSNGFTRPPGGAAFASTYAVDSVRVLASTRLSMVPAIISRTMGEWQLVARLIEVVNKE